MFYSRTVSGLEPGVNIYGYAFAEHGVGEAARLLARTARAAGIDYSVIPYTETWSRQQAELSDLGRRESIFDVNLIEVNADSIPAFAETVGAEQLEDRYNIGIWAWELESFPPEMARAAEYLDEIWGVSTFVADAIRPQVPCPVRPFPHAVPVPREAKVPRSELGIPEELLFLFCFDFNSILDRKNPLAVVRAFRQAFAPDVGARLLIKTINGEHFPREFSQLNAMALGRNDIDVVDGYLSAAEQSMLMSTCDVYISLHRSEGFGLTMAEAMARGKPVIATAYSGNLDFMTEHNSYLTPYEMVPVPAGRGPYPDTARWAQPDVGVAAQFMRRIYENPVEARAKGDQARKDIAALHSPEARASLLLSYLQPIRRRFARQGQARRAYSLLGFDPTAEAKGHEIRRELEAGREEKALRSHRESASLKRLFARRLTEFDPRAVMSEMTCGSLDGMKALEDGQTAIWGWAFDPRDQLPARAVILLRNGTQIPIPIQVDKRRHDVAEGLDNPDLETSGFSLVVPKQEDLGELHELEAYAVLRDGRLGRLPKSPSASGD